MKIKIISDGTPLGTKVLDENGIEITGICEVTWFIYPDGPARARLTFANVEIEAIGEADE